jgi:NTE family protein
MLRAMTTVALVLGAGGTKGFAHVGALKVLHENNVPIDLIVGASAGSLFGSLYAALGDPYRMERVMRHIKPAHLLRWYVCGLTCEPPSHLGRKLGEVLNGLKFPDLKIPFAAVSLDLATGYEVVIKEGRVAEAVRASISPPVLARPMSIGNQFLLDGGVHNTLPVDVAYGLGADVVVAVHLGDVFQLPRALRPSAALVAEGLGGAKLPTFLSQVAFTARLLANGRMRRKKSPDVLIKPNTKGLSSFSPFQVPLAIARGEAAAKKALPRIRRVLAEKGALRL